MRQPASLVRITDPKCSLRAELWKDLAQPNLASVSRLLGDLEAAVNSGFFGVAAEISASLRATATHVLEEEPTLRIPFELEEAKRLVYVGRDSAANSAIERVLNLIQSAPTGLPADDAAIWEFVAIGHRAWLVDDIEALQGIVERSSALLERLEIDSSILAGFQLGIEGRLLALRREAVASDRSFVRGCELLEGHASLRPLAYLRYYHAEHLKMLGEIDKAAGSAYSVLDCMTREGSHSHLQLRAILLLLSMESVVDDQERRSLSYRCWALLHAMGLSWYGTVSPLLQRAERATEFSSGWTLFDADRETALVSWLRDLSWRAMEAVLAEYYRCLGFTVEELPADAEAFDLIASGTDGAGFPTCIAIQVKHHRSLLERKDIPDLRVLRGARRLMEESEQLLPSGFHWHASAGMRSGARQELNARLLAEFPGSKLRSTTIERLAIEILQEPLWLPRIMMRVDLRFERMKPGQSARK